MCLKYHGVCGLSKREDGREKMGWGDNNREHFLSATSKGRHFIISKYGLSPQHYTFSALLYVPPCSGQTDRKNHDKIKSSMQQFLEEPPLQEAQQQ